MPTKSDMSNFHKMTLDDGSVVEYAICDAAGPFSRIHLNTNALFVRVVPGAFSRVPQNEISSEKGLRDFLSICKCKQDALELMADWPIDQATLVTLLEYQHTIATVKDKNSPKRQRIAAKLRKYLGYEYTEDPITENQLSALRAIMKETKTKLLP